MHALTYTLQHLGTTRLPLLHRYLVVSAVVEETPSTVAYSTSTTTTKPHIHTYTLQRLTISSERSRVMKSHILQLKVQNRSEGELQEDEEEHKGGRGTGRLGSRGVRRAWAWAWAWAWTRWAQPQCMQPVTMELYNSCYGEPFTRSVGPAVYTSCD